MIGALIIVVLLSSAILAIMLARERRRIRAAGISEERPGCPHCLYPLGGWSSPRCPECGCDVMIEGVRVGPRAHAWMRVLLWTVVIGGLLPLMIGATHWLLTSRHEKAFRGYSQSVPTGYGANISVERHWRRFPPLNEMKAALNVHSRDLQTSKTYVIQDMSAWPTTEQIAEALAQAAGTPLDSALGARADELLKETQAIWKAMQGGGRPALPAPGNSTPAGWNNTSSSHSFGSEQPGYAGPAILLITFVAAYLLDRRVIGRRRSGSRPACDGEWQWAGGYSTARSQQSS